ncbi:MAG TPA: indolepyruvate ferredoxin oxidoreductase family protein [Acidimicrobiales bacterium]|nr:indolepyruvate ferredoxin oxidoreductase family protein [Acidimicrobiales bacterium]
MVTLQREPGDLPSLADRFEAEQGEFFYSGMQALVRVLLDRRRRDAAAGLNTAAFVSGYPGSPLGGFDRELERQRTFLDRWGVVHRPGLNEDLAATAVMGSQLATTFPDATVDGVLGVWYGKAPGLDRSMDALRHAVYAGASPLGGALVLVGDDPASKSSTLPSASERILAEVSVPVLAPGTIQEILDYGVHAVELSRRSGLWAALKMVTPVADGTGTAVVGLDRPAVMPSTLIAADRVGSAGIAPPGSLAVERQLDDRLDAARDYAAANGLNRVVVDPPNPWLTIVAGGYPFQQTVEALANLGLTLRDLADYGVRLVNLGLVYPLVPAEVARWAAGTAELLVVEEKRSFVEQMVKDALYSLPDRPAVLGKTDAGGPGGGQPLVPGNGLLTADRLAEPLRRVLAHRLPADVLRPLPRRETIAPLLAPQESRTAFFCSGCPHPTGLRAPEDFTIGAGIGCHNLVKMLPASRVGEVTTLTQMGGEGAQWAGIEPFLPPRPFVQNLGDGTFMHSGSLAIRFAVASGLHMTYKILFNSAIAMTGGQDPVGEREVPDLCRLLLAEGVTAVIVTTDDLGRYRHVAMPKGAKVLDRAEVVAAQRELAALPGVTVLVHDQPCAAELRRLRKAGKASTPGHRLVINQAVCEGCGDCGAKSACLSLQPVMTDLGRKTAIQQTSCNLDFSCLQGDCPSFMEVRPSKRGAGRKARAVPEVPVELPDPTLIVDPADVRVRMPGIGGTGVVTVAQILGVAAGLDGKDVTGVDQTGVSQKAGPVVSEVHITDPGIGTGTGAGAGAGEARQTKVDVMVALDLIVAVTPVHLDGLGVDHTVVVGSTSPTSTGSMVMDSRQPYPDTGAMQAALESRARPGTACWVDGAAATQGLFGDSTTANVFVLGAAYQHGAIPVTAAAIERAIELNGAAVDVNLAAFRWGRCAVAAPDQMAARLGTAEAAATLPPDLAGELAALGLPEGTARLVARRAADLVGYQGSRTAQRYLATVAVAWAAERSAAPGSAAFTEAVARQLHRVTAYKDEYEVARLLTGPEATAQAQAVAGPGARVTWMLHPPALRAMGRKKKMAFGPWSRPVMAALRHGRVLRGTALDPFGRAEVRKEERRLAADVDALCRSLAACLGEVGATEAARIVGLADQVRGYEDVKLGNLARYRAELADALGHLPPAP